MIEGRRRDLALKLFTIGAVEFGAFRLKLHETSPEAPLSPLYFNLRTADNPKPGRLDLETLSLIGRVLYELLDSNAIDFDVVAGIPNAGDPIAEALIRAAAELDDDILLLRLEKEEQEDGSRRIVRLVDTAKWVTASILLVDDLVTGADTKEEAAAAVKQAELRVAGFAVLIDRQQGGSQRLCAAGYTVLSVFTLRDLLDFYVEEGLITSEKRQEVDSYLLTAA